ncbi:conserved hypothetical protein [Trichinella spiralis]|uniref:hypothetical protein n=1 Tax=Trichinella spiralis TaxID=6334 RepID=UPI0001EFE130|nr:conserved hypothetical protein [Trichinella spiralis]
MCAPAAQLSGRSCKLTAEISVYCKVKTKLELEVVFLFLESVIHIEKDAISPDNGEQIVPGETQVRRDKAQAGWLFCVHLFNGILMIERMGDLFRLASVHFPPPPGSRMLISGILTIVDQKIHQFGGRICCCLNSRIAIRFENGACLHTDSAQFFPFALPTCCWWGFGGGNFISINSKQSC